MSGLRTQQDPRFGLVPAVTRIAVSSALLVLLAIAAAGMAQAQTFTVIHNFTGAGDGGAPYAGLTMDRSGNFYGTTTSGAGSRGTVFQLKRAGSGWILATLYAFQGGADGGAPAGGVIVGADGSLYGMTQIGGTGCAPHGCGTVYRLRPQASVCRAVSCPWSITTIYNFDYDGGGYPAYGNLTFDQAGNLYGAASSYGAYGDGTVFKLTPANGSWTESVLWNFAGGADGALPYSTVSFDSAGNLYGTAYAGGAENAGTVYELSPSGAGWTEKTLYTFTGGNDGAQPIGGVAVDQHGNLFGTAIHGGAPGQGTAYELTPSGAGWTFAVLQNFSGYDGPFDTPMLDATGNVYLTSAYSTLDGNIQAGGVYKLTQSNGGWNASALYTFSGGNDGNIPAGNVIRDSNGNVYGTTVAGGSHGQGVIFEITPN